VLLPFDGECLALLGDAGYHLIMVTNQTGIAPGVITMKVICIACVTTCVHALLGVSSNSMPYIFVNITRKAALMILLFCVIIESPAPACC